MKRAEAIAVLNRCLGRVGLVFTEGEGCVDWGRDPGAITIGGDLTDSELKQLGEAFSVLGGSGDEVSEAGRVTCRVCGERLGEEEIDLCSYCS